jgi:hypothetical protein
MRAAGAFLLLLVASCGFLYRRQLPVSETAALEATPKPEPFSPPFAGCEGEGSNPDKPLNRRKNRFDEVPSYLPLSFDVVARLPWPAWVGWRPRDVWTRRERIEVGRFEGAPVSLEGYFVGQRVEIPEATNCYSTLEAMRDIHLWLAGAPARSIADAVVVEITPRYRALRPRWHPDTLRALIDSGRRVRVSGWLLLDELHPELVHIRRVTLWEIHPVTRLEVQDTTGHWTVF